MSQERERMDIYTGSDENEQIDMWLFEPALRPQFDAIDNLALKRKLPLHRLRDERPVGTAGFWQKLAHHCPWQRHTRSADARS